MLLSGCKTLVEQSYKLASKIASIDYNQRKQFNPGNHQQRIKKISIYDAECRNGYCFKGQDIELSASPKYPRGVTRSSRLQTIDFQYNDRGYLTNMKSLYLDFMARDYHVEHDIDYIYDEANNTVLAKEKAKHASSQAQKTSYLYVFSDGYPVKVIDTETDEVVKEREYNKGRLVFEKDFSKVYQFSYQNRLLSQAIISRRTAYEEGKTGLVINLSPLKYTSGNGDNVTAIQTISMDSYAPITVPYKGVIGQSISPESAKGVKQIVSDNKGYTTSFYDKMFDYANSGIRDVIVELEYESGAGNAFLLDNRTKDSQTNLEELLGLIYWR